MDIIINIILLVISYFLMLIVFLTLIIKYFSNFSENTYIWFCSKIKTIKNIINKNNNKKQVFSGFDEKKELLHLFLYKYKKKINLKYKNYNYFII